VRRSLESLEVIAGYASLLPAIIVEITLPCSDAVEDIFLAHEVRDRSEVLRLRLVSCNVGSHGCP
jgi:hypothetical protein